MRKVRVVGQVIKLFPIKAFTTKKGEEGKVANFILADSTSNIKVVLWDTNHIGLIEAQEICEGKVIEIKGGSMRDNEIHLGSFSELKLSDEILQTLLVKESYVSDEDMKKAIDVAKKNNTTALDYLFT